jgi:glycosyltransferase involved in cell wall biosynthesis
MKKILAIAPYSYLPYLSGGQKFIAKFFEYLGKEVDLTVVSVPNNDKPLASYKLIPLLKTSFSRYYDRSLFAKLRELIQTEKYDAIIWEHPYYGWLAKKIKKATGIKTIIHTHNIEHQRFRSIGKWWWPILRVYEKKCLRSADAVLFITAEDRDFAVSKWNLPKEKTWIVPFGVDTDHSPPDKAESREFICRQHEISPDEKIFLFNGVLSYKPNTDAVRHIIVFTNMVLRGSALKYKIILSGKGLPEQLLDALKDSLGKNIIYTGFVDDIIPYFKGADIFLNPVTSGGGIKTKMVEAIAYGTTVISTETGAAGMDKVIAGDKLVIINDEDWKRFGEAVIENAGIISPTPSAFYENFYWANIIKKLLNSGKI